MTFKFKRGLRANLPPASQVDVGTPLFTTDDGQLHIKMDSGEYSVIGSGPPSDLGISDVTGLQGALDAKVAFTDLPQNNDGTLNIAQQSTLVGLTDRQIVAGTGLAGGGDLSEDVTLSVSFAGAGNANTASRSDHTHAATELTTAAISTGYLKWNYIAGQGSWTIESVTASAPDFIDGGDANADDPNGGA